MKLDSEPGFCHSTLGHKPDSKPFDYNDIALDSALKSQNLIMTENQRRLLCDLKGNEKDAVPFANATNDGDGWTAIKFDCSMSMDDINNKDKDEAKDFVASHDQSSQKTESFDKDLHFVMDKGLMECELPELTVCYKESTYHVVKDICVDEGVPSREKILFESGRDKKTVCIVLPPDKDQNKELAKEKEDIDISGPDGLKLSAENDSNKDSANQYDSKDSIQTGEDATDFEESNNSSGNKVLPSSTLVYAGKESNIRSVDPETASPDFVSSAEEINNSTGDQMLASPTLVPTTELSNSSSAVNELFYNSKVESCSITFDFDSLEPSASGRLEGLENGDSECHETQKTSKVENGFSDAHTVSRRHQHALGETSFSAVGRGEESFSAVGTLSSLINYSGPMGYSGSISLRSDSSTTSTRSFAFPVLQSEWNSSPVRMAKADRRHFRKHRSWRQGLLCCKF
ncbi:hypothetical protein CIPAW_05G121600 [Carya illinoinensis]|uniref:18S pre-ribosomal assembly protein gar2-like protein n=1 Tax=Carya illinoinensis TaxID=32201 RepID=A0A8T1QHZ8_CARIL|nr:hypothetical protein CIPAW_05G121600 [Carya illinoinensis]KAG6654087.1 hypothetical protein CIPAW_05G121600 [Carya illinoinensis]KAG6654088.1 hypothetical protein CIPAW_05G121600 [Carya illinoinensis]KAG6654089.1 hypothetical protein CIPAW_05G121600 [Carya illinoinensis]KAG6654090.1 hypothetical protein CIPAW_05G121600 [Carya illinoinensis]